MRSVEIFLLNYNGLSFLKPCLEALANLTIRDFSYDVTLIDNGSLNFKEDSALELCPEKIKSKLSIIKLDNNYGFAKGNNLGIKKRLEELASNGKKPDYIVLLNTDTEVDTNWLAEALDSFKIDQRIGIVGSKAIFKDKFIVLKIHSPTYRPTEFGSKDTRELGVFLGEDISGSNISKNQSRFKYLNAYGKEGPGRWLSPDCSIFIPVENTSSSCEFSLALENHNAGPNEIEVSVEILGSDTQSIKINKGQKIKIDCQADDTNYQDVIQNAGSFVRYDICSGDLGAGDRGFLQLENGQFNTPEFVDSICGVSLLTKTEIWKELGGFDEQFFSYYEDTDFSLRARLNSYKCFYNPRSILRHIHCGSGIEYSDYFLNNVAWSRLVFESSFATPAIWQKTLKEFKALARHQLGVFKEDHNINTKPQLKAIARYYREYPIFLKKRIRARISKPWNNLSL